MHGPALPGWEERCDDFDVSESLNEGTKMSVFPRMSCFNNVLVSKIPIFNH